MEELEGPNKANKEKWDGDHDKNDCEKPPKRKRDECNDSPQIKAHGNQVLHPRENHHNLVRYGNLELCWFDEGCSTSDVKSSASQILYEANKEMKQQKCKAKRKNAARKQSTQCKNNASQTTGSKKRCRKKKANKKKIKVVKIKASTVPCKFYLEGKCSKSTDCTFSHAIQPLPKKELCKFYVFGLCAKGETCLYMHEEFPCKFFHTGVKCYSEPNCRFSHAPLTAETKELLVEYLQSNNNQDQENGENNKDESLYRQQETFNLPPCHTEVLHETVQASQVQQQQTHGSSADTGSQDPLPSPYLLWKPYFYTDTLVQSTATNPSSISMTPEIQSHNNSNLPIPQLVTTAGGYKNDENTHQNRLDNKANVDQENTVENKLQMAREYDRGRILQESKSYTTGLFVEECTAAKSASNSTKTEEKGSAGNSEKGNEPGLQQYKQEIAESSNFTTDMAFNQKGTTKPLSTLTQFPGESYVRVQQQKVTNSGTDVFKVPDCTRRGRNETTYNINKYTNKHLPSSTVHRKKEIVWSQPNTSQQYRPSYTLSASTGVTKILAETRQQVLQKSTLSRSSIDIGKMLREIRQQIMLKSSVVESNVSQQKDFWKNLLSGASATIKDTCSNITSDTQLQNKSDQFSRSYKPSADSVVSKTMSSINQRCQGYTMLTSRDPDVSLINSPSNGTVETSSAQLSLLLSSEDDSFVAKSNEFTTEKLKSAVENTNVPYKLHCITTSLPSYSSYAFVSPSNSNLLNDPRLQEYFKRQRLTVTSGQHLEGQFEKERKAHMGNDTPEPKLSLSEFWDWLKMPPVAKPRALAQFNKPPRRISGVNVHSRFSNVFP